LALTYFAAAFVVDAIFRGAAFCKYACPIGQFHFVNALASPFEVRTRDARTCTACLGKDCIAGGSGPRAGVPGCELWLFQAGKSGNLDCTFCLDCSHACPYDNVGVVARVPTSELWSDPRRAGIGRLGQRPDIAALAVVVVFAAYANALGMVGPFYDFERWLNGSLGGGSQHLALAVVFGLVLVVLPLLSVWAAAWASRGLAGGVEPVARVATRFAFALVPMGFGMWLAHYSFHFLTGALTVVPLAQSFVADFGQPFLGQPAWGLGPIVPGTWVPPIELVLLEAGLLGSLVTAYRIARDVNGQGSVAWRAFAPWAVLAMILFAAGAWLMLQPMEMRGTFGAG
jgi:hypothetical protein